MPKKNTLGSHTPFSTPLQEPSTRDGSTQRLNSRSEETCNQLENEREERIIELHPAPSELDRAPWVLERRGGLEREVHEANERAREALQEVAILSAKLEEMKQRSEKDVSEAQLKSIKAFKGMLWLAVLLGCTCVSPPETWSTVLIAILPVVMYTILPHFADWILFVRDGPVERDSLEHHLRFLVYAR